MIELLLILENKGEINMKQITRILLIIALFALALTACAKEPANKLESIQKAGKIVVGTSADYEPWEYMDDNGNFAGADMDIMREIAKRMGVEVEFQDLGFDALVTAVKEGKVDAAIAAMASTDERKESVDFSIVYYAGDNVFVTTADSGITFDNPLEAANYTMGTQSGTIMYYWVDANLIQPGLMDADNLSLYERNEQIALDLQAGRIQLAIMDLEPGKQFMADPDFGFVEVWRGPLDPNGQAIPIMKGETELKAELDKHINDLLNEGFIRATLDSYGIE
jgi:polar amino acid transport system substrate-binding protein